MISEPMFPRDYRLRNGVFFQNQIESEDFTYSDGEVFEERIAAIIRNATDKSLFSTELTSEIWDWRSRCHLSPARANLLRPLDHLCNRRVLELGSGCGPITRYLGELGGDIVALEASAFRAGITRERTLDLPNVRVACERIENFVSETKFDVVTLIGVLQYARLFTGLGTQAEKSLLENAARQLDEHGVLVLAIQNQLGLKYLAGWPEPNVGLPYFGINGLYEDKTVIRFGKQQLQELLTSVGLPHQTFLFPFPDYHIASLILSANGIQAPEPFRADELIAMAAAGDLARPDYERPAFSLERAHATCHANGLTADLANAFLVVAGRTPQSIASVADADCLGWHYTAERYPQHTVDTRFIRRGKAIDVTRTPLVAHRERDVASVQRLSDEAYLPGQLQWTALVDTVNRRNWTIEDVAARCRPWLDTLAVEAGLTVLAGRYPWDAMVSGRFYDATPSNMIQSPDGSSRFFDQEWHLPDALGFDFIAFRGVIGSLTTISSFAPPDAATPVQVMPLAYEILRALGLPDDESWLKKQLTREFSIQRALSPGAARYEAERWIADMLLLELRIRRDLSEHGAAQLAAVMRSQEQRLKQQELVIEQKQRQVEQQGATISAFEASVAIRFQRKAGRIWRQLFAKSTT